jgi:type II secretory pathway pseudopilin PulG
MVVRRPARRVGASKGFTYLTILFVVAIMGIGLALVGQMWQTVAVREREAELLQVGNEYRKAIERYYLSGPRQYPRTLADLLMDPRQPGTARYLRKLYPDPVSGKDEWGLVPAPDGGIAGVYSVSESAPLKSAGFAVRDNGFEGKSKYSEWKFVYVPQQEAQPVTAPKPPA